MDPLAIIESLQVAAPTTPPAPAPAQAEPLAAPAPAQVATNPQVDQPVTPEVIMAAAAPQPAPAPAPAPPPVPEVKAPDLPTVSSFTLKIGELVESGRAAEVPGLISLYNTDVAALSDVDAVRLKYSLMYPTATAARIDALIIHQERFDPSDTDNDANIAGAMLAAAPARQFIAERQSELKTQVPAAVPQATQATGNGADATLAPPVADQAFVESWKQVIETPEFFQPLNYKQAFEGVGEYSFDWTPTAEAQAAAREQAIAIVKSQNNGTLPLDQNSLNQVRQMTADLAFLADRNAFIDALVKDVVESVRTQTLRAASGTAPAGVRPQGMTPPPQPKSLIG